jgi:hypothetical protein
MERNDQKQIKNIWKPLCILFAVLLALSWVFFGSLYGSGKINLSGLELNEPNNMADTGGAVIGESVENGMNLMSAKIPISEYAANDISSLAESAYTLTATVLPADATDKTVDWTVAFADPASEWATGKTVTDYVTVTPTSDGALTATVTCLEDFGEQIIVTVTSRNNPEAKATCTVDYRKRVESFYISIAGNVFNGAEYTTKSPINFKETLFQSVTLRDIVFTDYTIDVEYTRMSLNIALTSEFREAAGLGSSFNYYEIAKCSDITWTPGATTALSFDPMFASLFYGLTDDDETMQTLRDVCTSLSEHFSFYLYWDEADTILNRQTFRYDGGTFNLLTFGSSSVSSVTVDPSAVTF